MQMNTGQRIALHGPCLEEITHALALSADGCIAQTSRAASDG